MNVALQRIAAISREAAGYDSTLHSAVSGADIPLGEFADALAALMPGVDGPGARSDSRAQTPTTRRRGSPGSASGRNDVPDTWIDGGMQIGNESTTSPSSPGEVSQLPSATASKNRPPQIRVVGEPEPTIASDGSAVIRYPFELRCRGNTVRLTAAVEIMSSDGGQVETEAPIGTGSPTVRSWIDPLGSEHRTAELEVKANDSDGRWEVEVILVDEAMMRIDLKADGV